MPVHRGCRTGVDNWSYRMASTKVNWIASRKLGVLYVVLCFFFLLLVDVGTSFRLYLAAFADWTAERGGRV